MLLVSAIKHCDGIISKSLHLYLDYIAPWLEW